ncbi:MAG TPA: sugar ABC transporter ATP-binding protein [Pusillimonas sp.]|uniref:sugar ABC transporter ATP-binding protein n=1 Tax=Pusillimonas sp. TaxID=3040095 RepID=UPI002B650B94|nr:sugar ABC transporter ATP-binding protein [Pusillimonas sp.]HUH88341.1 sugar ABC transporter ATP-binding protein [Pusillimonas sp.]
MTQQAHALDQGITSSLAAPVLSTQGLSKCYGAHYALRNVSIDLMPGQVHVMFGENGAGKSTLISMIAGANQPSSGHIQMDGMPVKLDSVAQARALGVRAVFQEFSLIPHLTVAQNIVLGEEQVGPFGFLAKSLMCRRAARLITDLGFDLDPDTPVEQLARGRQQMVEICKAAGHSPRVLILDEPTASLSEHDTQALFALVRKLKSQGSAIVYITHRMHEIAEIGDKVSVLRDGQLVATVNADTPEDELIRLMTGRTVSDIYPAPVTRPGAVRLSIKELAGADGCVLDASLDVRAGEIVGLAGLVGCGKSELGQVVFGAAKRLSGRVELDGKPVHFKHPADAIESGLWYSPPDRKHDGLALVRPAFDNMALSSLQFGRRPSRLRRPRQEDRLVSGLASKVEFPFARRGESVANFSGGNQQKVLLAKGLAQDIDVYVFDEPTVGVDVGARQAIYKYFNELSAAGAAILLISSDLSELLGLSHRLLVMREGRTVAEFARADFDQHAILEQFFN